MDKQVSYLEKMKFNSEDYFVKHTTISPIYKNV